MAQNRLISIVDSVIVTSLKKINYFVDSWLLKSKMNDHQMLKNQYIKSNQTLEFHIATFKLWLHIKIYKLYIKDYIEKNYNEKNYKHLSDSQVIISRSSLLHQIDRLKKLTYAKLIQLYSANGVKVDEDFDLWAFQLKSEIKLLPFKDDLNVTHMTEQIMVEDIANRLMYQKFENQVDNIAEFQFFKMMVYIAFSEYFIDIGQPDNAIPSIVTAANFSGSFNSLDSITPFVRKDIGRQASKQNKRTQLRFISDIKKFYNQEFKQSYDAGKIKQIEVVYRINLAKKDWSAVSGSTLRRWLWPDQQVSKSHKTDIRKFYDEKMKQDYEKSAVTKIDVIRAIKNAKADWTNLSDSTIRRWLWIDEKICKS